MRLLTRAFQSLAIQSCLVSPVLAVHRSSDSPFGEKVARPKAAPQGIPTAEGDSEYDVRPIHRDLQREEGRYREGRRGCEAAVPRREGPYEYLAYVLLFRSLEQT